MRVIDMVPAASLAGAGSKFLQRGREILPLLTNLTSARVPQLIVDAVNNGPTTSGNDNWFVLPPDVARWDPFVVLGEDKFRQRQWWTSCGRR